MPTTRRDFLIAGAASGAAIWLPDWVREADAASRRRVPLARDGTFATGVLSGDPEPTAVTVLARLDGQDAPRLRVRLEVARDPDFRRIVVRRDVPVTRLRDHTVKARVRGLQPDERYWFRFATRTTTSPVGRTQTAPPPDSRRTIRIGYFSCQDFASGYYGAYRALLELDPDVVVCGGDYIYDRIYSEDGYGGVRPDTVGEGPKSVARTIDHYRAKYRLYRSDPDLAELQRLVPLVAQWDDHEVTDNYVATHEGSDADNGQPEDAYDRARVLAGWRAWHEYMPALRFGRSLRTYRGFRFGRNAELFMLDVRAGRDDQPCDEGFAPCAGTEAPRPYLGREQLGWLKDGLARSDAGWKVVANPQMIMPFRVAPEVPVELDSWQGYRAERRDLLTHVRNRSRDVVFLTGDIHTFFAGEVRLDGETGPPVAVELVGGSTTSLGTAETLSEQGSSGAAPPAVIEPISDPGVSAVNPWITYADTNTHGCALVEASPGELRTRYLGSESVKDQEASRRVRTIADLRVHPGVPRVEVAARG